MSSIYRNYPQSKFELYSDKNYEKIARKGTKMFEKLRTELRKEDMDKLLPFIAGWLKRNFNYDLSWLFRRTGRSK